MFLDNACSADSRVGHRRWRCARTTKFFLVSMLLVFANISSAEQRYQAITVGPGYEFGSEKVMILDTEAGHLWIWVESPATDKKKGGRYLIYQGQTRPGREMGEVIGSQEWGPGS